MDVLKRTSESYDVMGWEGGRDGFLQDFVSWVSAKGVECEVLFFLTAPLEIF